MKKIEEMKKDFLLLGQFTIEDFKGKYAGSFLGIIWAFIQPIITIVIYWFIFQVGFRSEPVENYPFILWLVAGLASWLYISEAIINATSSLVEYSYLVKKVMFNINILPMIKVCSAFLVQIFIVLFTVILFWVYGYAPDVFYLQLLYYAVYMVVFVTGIAYLTAGLYVFFKDTLQIVSILIQLIFWLTPIVWSLNIMPEQIQTILKGNPIYYVVTGYRDSLIDKKWFWENPKEVLYFWMIAILVFTLGKWIYRRFKPHFADVL